VLCLNLAVKIINEFTLIFTTRCYMDNSQLLGCERCAQWSDWCTQNGRKDGD